MPAIHLIEREFNLKQVDRANQTWETGDWVVAVATAERLVGGHIYLHETQNSPSRFGGLITGWRLTPDNERVIFIFKFQEDCRNVKTSAAGWGREKKLVG